MCLHFICVCILYLITHYVCQYKKATVVRDLYPKLIHNALHFTCIYILYVLTFYMYLRIICIYTNICIVYGAKRLIEFAIHIL